MHWICVLRAQSCDAFREGLGRRKSLTSLITSGKLPEFVIEAGIPTKNKKTVWEWSDEVEECRVLHCSVKRLFWFALVTENTAPSLPCPPSHKRYQSYLGLLLDILHNSTSLNSPTALDCWALAAPGTPHCAVHRQYYAAVHGTRSVMPWCAAHTQCFAPVCGTHAVLCPSVGTTHTHTHTHSARRRCAVLCPSVAHTKCYAPVCGTHMQSCAPVYGWHTQCYAPVCGTYRRFVTPAALHESVPANRSRGMCVCMCYGVWPLVNEMMSTGGCKIRRGWVLVVQRCMCKEPRPILMALVHFEHLPLFAVQSSGLAKLQGSTSVQGRSGTSGYASSLHLCTTERGQMAPRLAFHLTRSGHLVCV